MVLNKTGKSKPCIYTMYVCEAVWCELTRIDRKLQCKTTCSSVISSLCLFYLGLLLLLLMLLLCGKSSIHSKYEFVVVHTIVNEDPRTPMKTMSSTSSMKLYVDEKEKPKLVPPPTLLVPHLNHVIIILLWNVEQCI